MSDCHETIGATSEIAVIFLFILFSTNCKAVAGVLLQTQSTVHKWYVEWLEPS